MAWECSAASMRGMINLLKSNGIIKDPRVESAMLQTDRAHYCPSRTPYMDTPHGIGFGATISAPHMHAHALEFLAPKLVDGARALDVGSGSGYLTACLAHMVGPRGKVIGVEHISELMEQSEQNIKADCSELIDSGRIKLYVSDGRIGFSEFAPYDVIHVGATVSGLPEKLVEQLKTGGRMVLPIQVGQVQMFESIDKLPGGEIKRTQHFGVRYVPLTDVKQQLGKV